MTQIPKTMLIILLLMLALPAFAGKHETPQQSHFRFACTDQTTFSQRFLQKMLTEAFVRNGYTISFVNVDNMQLMAEKVMKGEFDGDIGRVLSFADNGAHPGYFRIDERVVTLNWSAWAMQPVDIESWDDLAQMGVTIGYRTGNHTSEVHLVGKVPDKLLIPVPNTEDGIQGLLDGSIKIMVFANNFSIDELLRSDTYKNSGIRKVKELIRVPIYPYFNAKHKKLAPSIAKALKEIKRSGLSNTLLQQSLQEASRTTP